MERDSKIGCSRAKLHCHCLAVDANGRVGLARLAEFMRSCVVEYTIPRSRIQEARRYLEKYNSTRALSNLFEESKRTFTDLEKSGEGGELLLFLLAERLLLLPQVLCKMSLKTAERMHYHGADGVYASVDDSGRLLLYWGESKIYSKPEEAVRDCLSSLGPFLSEPDSEDAARERDMLLLTDVANLEDASVLNAFRKYFDKTSPMSKRVRYCGIALVGFDASYYPEENEEAVAEVLARETRAGLIRWSSLISGRITAERLERFDIHFFCLPLPSAVAFRTAFRRALGIIK